jgi:hypothetical protein
MHHAQTRKSFIETVWRATPAAERALHGGRRYVALHPHTPLVELDYTTLRKLAHVARHDRMNNRSGPSVDRAMNASLPPDAAASTTFDDIVEVLRSHTDETTAYVVADYPYGFRLRTQIRYWLEQAPKKGFRFVSQTMNPKNGRWNAPKKSTYIEYAAVMYKNAEGHVHWTGIGPYTNAADALAFLAKAGGPFPVLAMFAKAKARFERDMASGRRYLTINDVRQPEPEGRAEEREREARLWDEVARRAA